MSIREKILDQMYGSNEINSLIAEFIIKDIENFDMWTHKYFSEKLFCSKSSISRFFNNIGFKNFNEFYYEYKNEINYKNELKIKSETKKVTLTIKPDDLIHDLKLNLDIIFNSIEKINFNYIKQLIVTKRRVLILLNAVHYSLFSKMLINALMNQNNIQVISMDVFDESFISNFNQDDIFICLFIEKLDFKEFNIIKQFSDKKITMINIADFLDISFEQNYKNYLINFPKFRDMHDTFFLKTLYVQILTHIFDNIF